MNDGFSAYHWTFRARITNTQKHCEFQEHVGFDRQVILMTAEKTTIFVLQMCHIVAAEVKVQSRMPSGNPGQDAFTRLE